MEHRNYGETENCKGCRFWSEVLAKSVDDHVEAMCINTESDTLEQYRPASSSCGNWKSGHFGAIDTPCEQYQIIKAYKDEESGE